MSGTPVSEYPEITRDMLELRSDLNSAYAEIASLRAQLDEARAKLKRKKEASAQIEKTATEAWHLIAALPYSSAAGELEEKLRALLSESKT